MRVLNPWTQRLLSAKPRGEPPFIPHPAVFNTVSGGVERPRGKPPATSFFCDYAQMMGNGRARGDPPSGPGAARGDPAPHFIVEVMGRRSRGDPGG